MRSSEKDQPYSNWYEMSDNAKIIGTLVNIQPKMAEHILRLSYLASLHKLSNKVLDADSKLNEVKLEIPYYGVLILKVKDNKIEDVSFICEDELINDVNNTVSTGDSPLVSEAKKKVGERISKRYQELL